MTASVRQLLVPIDLQAFCVGEHDTYGDATDGYGTVQFARLAPDFSVLPYLKDGAPQNQGANLSAQALPEPFAATDKPLGCGVHLHWALPDALVRGHGDPEGHGDIRFREAPNRWLVVRVMVRSDHPSAPKTTLRGWIVESDRAWVETDPSDLKQNQRSGTRPTRPRPQAQTNRAYTRVGKVYDLSGWREDPTAGFVERTDALGYGDIGYAAAYPLCGNVFGFQDLLDDLPSDYDPTRAGLAYLVTGWYSDASRDPIAVLARTPGITVAQFVQTLRNEFSWTVDPPSEPATDVPAALLCQGTIDSISWDPGRRYVTTPAPDGRLRAAIGNNRIEAVSAMLAAQPSLRGLPNVEILLQSLQAGLLPSYTSELATVEEQLHERQFGSLRAGHLWRIQAQGDAAAETEARKPVPRPALELPARLAQLLDELNLAQAAVDRAAHEITSRRRQVFADWAKYMMVEYPPVGEPPVGISADDAQQLIAAEIDALNAQVRELETVLMPALAKCRTELENALPQKTGPFQPLKSELVRMEAPRHWMPTDPVVLIAGDAATPPTRHGGGDLVCRTTDQLTASVKITGPGGRFSVDAEQLPSLPDGAGSGPRSALAAILSEAVLVLPTTAPTVAAALAAEGSPGNPAATDFADFVTQLRKAQGVWLGGASPEGEIKFSGAPPSPVGCQTWKGNPWIPLLLQWRVNLQPQRPVSADRAYPVDFITTGYRLDDEAIDLEPREPPSSDPQPTIYEGTVGLAGRTTINIERQIKTFLDSHDDDAVDPELRKILNQFPLLKTPMLAQALGGLRQATQMRHEALQLPVNDPLAELNGPAFAKFSNQTVPAAVGGQNTAGALANGDYNPINAGHLTVLKLRLVDAFGQVREIEVDDGALIRSRSLRPATDPPGRRPVLLRPRFAQPSRLRFRWLAADSDRTEMNAVPASSPIFGWVLFNHLDSSLMIYDQAGAALGSFDIRGPFWQGAPGNDATFDKTIEEVFASANAHLRAFALGLHGNPEPQAFLGDLLRTINDTVTLVVPPNAAQHRASSVLFGRPLALVRAELGLELRGRSGIDESWNALAQTIERWQDRSVYPDHRPDAGFPDVKVPVRLGDISNLSDGLIGYFIDDGSSGTYRTFYAAAADRLSGEGVRRPATNTVTVTPRRGSKPVKVMMLLDPRAAVHATTGLLPVKSIEIPPPMYSDALRNMAVVFLATPLMTNAFQWTVPVPREPGFGWSLITRSSTQGGWSVVDDLVPPNPKAALSYPPQRLVEAWLRLTPQKKNE